MTKVFYLSEIVKFAIEKEIESVELYQKLAGSVSKPELQQLFRTLVVEEQKHKAFYSDMLSFVDLQQTPGVHEDDEYTAYMQEMIRAARAVAALTGEQLNDFVRVIDYAIAREKDSILFYVGLKHLVADKDKAAIDKIIYEEGRHIVFLARMR
jgi:rubrerythrin